MLDCLKNSSISVKTHVLQNSPDYRRIFNKGDNLHLSMAPRAFESIDIPDLLEKFSRCAAGTRSIVVVPGF